MENELKYRSIGWLLDLLRNQMLKANPEYQRGLVWGESQQKRLIDSVMRGYPLPVIYLHHIRRDVNGMQRDDLEIIDGQQRINAFHAFHEGTYQLFDPRLDDAQARFPVFLKEQPCPWGRKSFESLPQELQKRFLEKEVPVAEITSPNPNEVRDLFVRLQAGLPLGPQEKRDAQPGDFTQFVLKLGGKAGLVRFPGNPFFRQVAVPSAARGGVRTLAAQIAMLFLTRRQQGPMAFSSITSGAVDDYYYKHIDFDSDSDDCRRLLAILNKLNDRLGDGKRPKLRAHVAIHLVLLLDDLWDDYVGSWESRLPAALDRFLDDMAKSSKLAQEAPAAPNDFWSRYGQWARTASSDGPTIQRRHSFFAEQMRAHLTPLELKDPTRLFGILDQEIMYFRDAKTCQRCFSEVAWDDAQFHHVKEHHVGGTTNVGNGALVHRWCHPKSEADVKDFAEQWHRRGEGHAPPLS